MQQVTSLRFNPPPVSLAHKSFPLDALDKPVGDLVGRRLLDSFATPVATISQPALDHNVDAMKGFCAERGVELAPHAKTTMSPELVERQLQGGAWAITAASPWQARVFASWGVPRIVIANVSADGRALAELFAYAPDTEIWLFVDSVAGAQIASAAVPEGRVLPVIIEVGVAGGRGGVRTNTAGQHLADEIGTFDNLALAGIGTFEGVVSGGRAEGPQQQVRDLLTRLRGLAESLMPQFSADFPLVLTAGGSMYFDLVCDILRDHEYDREVKVVLRSGGYITHDDGIYADDPVPLSNQFLPALRVWARVLSVPEPGWAIIDAGKRDLTVDGSLARVKNRHRGGEVHPLPLRVQRHNDQHGYLAFAGDDLQVGDIVEMGVSHPCLTFDKWRAIPVIDDDLTVTGTVHTYF